MMTPPSHQEKACAYYGYIPGGEQVNISPIPPIEVEAGEDTLDDALGTVGHISTYGNSIMTIAGGMVEAGSRAATVCPVAAGIFGMVGLVSGIWGGNRAPDPLEVMEEALNDLTKYINDRLDDVVNYVDQAILEAQKGYVEDVMEECQLKWEGCLSKSVTREAGLLCQIVVENDIASKRPHFMHYENNMSPAVDGDGNILPVPDVVHDGKWDPYKNKTLLTRRFCEELYPGLCPLYSDVRLMEGTAASFTQYATLHMYLLISIYGDFVNATNSEVDNRWEHMRVYLEEIVHLGALYYQYADWLYSWAYERNLHENYNCVYNKEDCYQYNFECDQDGWQDVYYSPPWNTKDYNTIDYLTCWNHFNNMLTDSKCSQTLEVRVDGKGAQWMSENPDTVWKHGYSETDYHVVGDAEESRQFVIVKYDHWDYDRGVAHSDLVNWWEANVMVEARKWQELHTTALDTLNREFGPSSTSGIKVNEAVYQQLKAELAASRQFK